MLARWIKFCFALLLAEVVARSSAAPAESRPVPSRTALAPPNITPRATRTATPDNVNTNVNTTAGKIVSFNFGVCPPG